MDKINLLVNLPAGFYKTSALKPIFARLTRFANVRRRSWNTADEIRKDLAWADAVLMWSWPKLLPDLLDQAPRLKFAAQLDISQGAANVALERGLPISQGRSAWSPAVAEMALTLTLAALRKTSDYHAAMRAGNDLPTELGFGWSVPPEDPHALAVALRTLAAMPDADRAVLARRAREAAEQHYAYPALARRFADLFAKTP